MDDREMPSFEIRAATIQEVARLNAQVRQCAMEMAVAISPSVQRMIGDVNTSVAAMGVSTAQAAEAVRALGRELRREIARRVRALSRSDRRLYWIYRTAGVEPFDALADMARHQRA